MKIINSRLKVQIRNAVGKPMGDLTEDDLKKIIGIHIGHNNEGVVYIPWHSDGQAYQMKVPNLFLTPDMINAEDMKLFSHISSFHSVVNDLTINFLSAFPNLFELYLSGAIVDDWSFLSRLDDLSKVFIRKCGKNGDEILRLLANLRKSQKGSLQPYKPVLDDVILKYLGITDISPFQGIPNWTELDLSHNDIEDVSPLNGSHPYYLTLRHNKIIDVSSLENCLSYLINLRHNKVRDLKPIIMNKTKNPQLKRLFVWHNPASEDDLRQLRVLRWVQQDFIRDRM